MAESIKTVAACSEMAIVDLFTRLIFDAESSLDTGEKILIELLCHHEPMLQCASRRDISEYLRAMPIDEMINVVALLKHQLENHPSLLVNGMAAPQNSLRH
jgi:hypothetical protein